VPGDDGVRSNLGIVNPGTQTAEVLGFVFAYGDDGELEHFGTFRMDVGPGGWVQQDIFRLVDLHDQVIENAYAIVAGDDDVVNPQTPLFTYVSRIDNRSGDAVFNQPFLNLRHEIDPDAVTMHYSIQGSGTFAPFAVVYPGPDGAEVDVLDPALDWTADVVTDANQILCLEAIGRIEGPGEGTVSACVSFTGPGGDEDPTCRECSGVAGDLCRVEACRHVY
jgi:hypothetical protein